MLWSEEGAGPSGLESKGQPPWRPGSAALPGPFLCTHPVEE